jgi:hypothetical protein
MVLLEGVFQYESSSISYVPYYQYIVVQFVRSKFFIKCACVLFIGMEVVVLHVMLTKYFGDMTSHYSKKKKTVVTRHVTITLHITRQDESTNR